jgi:hypothetical protein
MEQQVLRRSQSVKIEVNFCEDDGTFRSRPGDFVAIRNNMSSQIKIEGAFVNKKERSDDREVS